MIDRLISPLDFSQVRLAPLSVLAGLREVDPTADLVHFGDARWLLVSVRGDDDMKAQGYRRLANAKAMSATVQAKNPGIKTRHIPRIKDGIAAATLISLGARPIDFYHLPNPDSSVVEDFRRADFKSRHTSDADFWLEYESPREKAREAHLKDLTDHARANAYWHYSNVLTHTTSVKMAASVIPDRSSTRKRIEIPKRPAASQPAA
jgi:hypothetical protein